MGLLAWMRKVFGTGAASRDLGIPDFVELDEIVDLGARDTLDLHAFQPRDVRAVVVAFLDEAEAAGFAHVRIIHGKGIGVQRAIVRGVLEKHPAVLSFGTAIDGGGWGATVVNLKPRP